MNLKIHSLFRKKERLADALSLLDPNDEKLRDFREYFKKEIDKTQKEIDKEIEKGDGVIK